MTKPPSIQVSLVLPKSGAFSLTPKEAVALLKIAFLAGEADGRIADEEQESFKDLAAGLRKLVKESDQMTDAKLDAQLDDFAEEVEKDGREAALKELAKACGRPLVRDVAYKVAVAMSVADMDQSDDESSFDDDLMQALKLSEEQANLLAQDVYAALETETE